MDETTVTRLYRESMMGLCLDQALAELSVRHGLSTELHEDTMAQFDHEMHAALEKQVGPAATVRGRIVCFKYFMNTWTFHLQPGFVTWDRPSNAHSWVRFEKLRLVLADKVKVRLNN
ncbi:hypothetical protein T492DRAFT_848754 [Pavlovales sp. CCMP2436]|nr:hypothetical protein T492DRAFT_848754 [Pavlovales sp. CCMP2436]